MKRWLLLLLFVLALLFSSCGNGDQTASPGETDTSPGEIPSPTATPTPDFAGTDFSGRWYVSQIIDSNGQPVSDAEKQTLGAGFILELLPNGTYFVYGEDGKVLGQGAYSVTLNELTLAAQASQTVYEIVDVDTLRITEPDTSITIMKREAEEPLEEGDAAGTDDTGDTAEGEDIGDTAEGEDSPEEETDFIDETEPEATPSPDTSQAPPE